jgi:hypothetical protein
MSQTQLLKPVVSFDYEEIAPGLFTLDDTCIEVNHRDDNIYSVTKTIRHGSKRFLGGIEQISSEQWAVRWMGRDEIPVTERIGGTRLEAIAFLAATKGVR